MIISFTTRTTVSGAGFTRFVMRSRTFRRIIFIVFGASLLLRRSCLAQDGFRLRLRWWFIFLFFQLRFTRVLAGGFAGRLVRHIRVRTGVFGFLSRKRLNGK